MMRFLTIPLISCVFAVGCGSGGADDDDSADAAQTIDAIPSTDTPPAPDAPPAIDATPDATPWPPEGPFHDGKSCTLPECDTEAEEVPDLSGTWTQTLTTVSHNCDPAVEAINPKLVPGHVETMTGLSMARDGECLYSDTIGGTLFGVIKNGIAVSCQVLPAEMGVTPVTEGITTFEGDEGSGTATTFLFDIPVFGDCSADYTVTFERE